MRMRVMGLVWTVVTATPGCAEEPLDEVHWACASDRDCGLGMQCRLGLCVRRGSEPGRGLVCEASGVSDATARFAIEGDRDARTFVFSTGGREARFPLPDEIVALDEAPLEACCESPCCALLPESAESAEPDR